MVKNYRIKDICEEASQKCIPCGGVHADTVANLDYIKERMVMTDKIYEGEENDLSKGNFFSIGFQDQPEDQKDHICDHDCQKRKELQLKCASFTRFYVKGKQLDQIRFQLK